MNCLIHFVLAIVSLLVIHDSCKCLGSECPENSDVCPSLITNTNSLSYIATSYIVAYITDGFYIFLNGFLFGDYISQIKYMLVTYAIVESVPNRLIYEIVDEKGDVYFLIGAVDFEFTNTDSDCYSLKPEDGYIIRAGSSTPERLCVDSSKRILVRINYYIGAYLTFNGPGNNGFAAVNTIEVADVQNQADLDELAKDGIRNSLGINTENFKYILTDFKSLYLAIIELLAVYEIFLQYYLFLDRLITITKISFRVYVVAAASRGIDLEMYFITFIEKYGFLGCNR